MKHGASMSLRRFSFNANAVGLGHSLRLLHRNSQGEPA
jgi:hypothetical protein